MTMKFPYTVTLPPPKPAALTFTVNDDELKTLDEWMKTHTRKNKPNKGKRCFALREKRYPNVSMESRRSGCVFVFSRRSGIGMHIEAQCECGATKDITDYDSW